MSRFSPPRSRGRSRYRLTCYEDLYGEQNPDEVFDRSAHSCESESDSGDEKQGSKTNPRFFKEFAKPDGVGRQRKGGEGPSDVGTGRHVLEDHSATNSPPKKLTPKRKFGFFSSMPETPPAEATSAESPTANMASATQSARQTFRLVNGEIIVDDSPNIDFTANGANGLGNLGDGFSTLERDRSLPPDPYEAHTNGLEAQQMGDDNSFQTRALTSFSDNAQPPSKQPTSLLGQHPASTEPVSFTHQEEVTTSTTPEGAMIPSTERACDEGYQADQNEFRQPPVPEDNSPKKRVGRPPKTQTPKNDIATLPSSLGRTRAATTKQIEEKGAERLARRPCTRSTVPAAPVKMSSSKRNRETARAATLLKRRAKKVVGGIADRVNKRGMKKQPNAIVERPVKRLKVEKGKAVVVIPREHVNLEEYQRFD